MISKRNYFIILIIMGIILFLFQFSQIVKDYGNDYYYNENTELKIPARAEWEQLHFSVEDDFSAIQDGDYILFLGDEESNEGKIVSQWTLYSKRNLMVIDSLGQYSIEKHKKPEFLLVDSGKVNFDEETEVFEKFTEEGISIVFLNLPDVSVIENNKELKSLLGISLIKDEDVTVEGIKLFSGFLLGGETIYEPKKKSEERRQDLDLTMPWYITSGGTKTYMVGLMEGYYDKDYKFKNDDYPAIIWRHSFGESQVFCVNGDYMSDTAGLGILSAMIYELSSYQLYPIVNAQNTLVVDFPLMSNENDEEINRIYSMSLNSFQTDIVWPTLITLAEKNKIKYTCFMAPQYNYSDEAGPSLEAYDTFVRFLGEKDSEIGLSLNHAEGISLLEKLSIDKDYYDLIENKYPATSAFMDLSDVDELEEAVLNPYVRGVRTIACDENISLPILSYINDDITLQSLTSNTKNFTYSKDLMLKSIETALGYDNAKLNLSAVAWPESNEDHWENIYNDMASSLETYWRPFRVFERTTLAESDQRVRTFLNLDYECVRTGDEINLEIMNTEGATVWFILRTHGEMISSCNGASYEEIEDNVYLIETDNTNVTFKLKDANAIGN